MFYHEFIFTWKYRQAENLVPVSLQKKMYTCAFFPMDSSRVNSPCSSPRLPFTWLATRGIRESLSYNTPICNLSVPDTVFHIRSSCHVTLNRGPSPLTSRFLGRGKVPSVNMKFPEIGDLAFLPEAMEVSWEKHVRGVSSHCFCHGPPDFGRHLFGKRHVKNLYCLEAYRYGLLFGGTSLGFPFPFFAGNGITPDICVITSRVGCSQAPRTFCHPHYNRRGLP